MSIRKHGANTKHARSRSLPGPISLDEIFKNKLNTVEDVSKPKSTRLPYSPSVDSYNTKNLLSHSEKGNDFSAQLNFLPRSSTNPIRPRANSNSKDEPYPTKRSSVRVLDSGLALDDKVYVTTYELLLIFVDFFAMDLFAAGRYFIKTTLNPDNKNCHTTIEIQHQDLNDTSADGDAEFEFKPPTIDSNSFTTSSFSVRFKNQKITLNDMFSCRITTVRNDENTIAPHFEIDFELLFIPKTSQNHTVLCKKTIQIKQIETGLQIFYPLLFDNVQFAYVDMGIDSALLSVDIHHQHSPELSKRNSRKFTSGRAVTLTPGMERLVMQVLSESEERLDAKQQSITGLRKKTPSFTTPNFNINPATNEVIPEVEKEDVHRKPSLKRQSNKSLLDIVKLDLNESWGKYKDLIKVEWSATLAKNKLEILQKLRFLWSKRILTEYNYKAHQRYSYGEIAKTLMKNLQFEDTNLKDFNSNPAAEEGAVLIEVPYSYCVDDTIPPPTSISSQLTENSVHLIVFVHGLAATKNELRLAKDYLRFVLDQIQSFEFLMISSIEGRTVNEGLESLGKRVAEEIVAEIQQIRSKNQKRVAKISFVGHSMGGVIIRSALANECFKPYRQNLHTFISLSSPHLGTVGATRIIKSATWVFQKLVNSQSIAELRLRDGDSIDDTFLYRLTLNEPLANFRNILLFSSSQDDVVPSCSARIEPMNITNFSDRMQSQYDQMQDNIIKAIEKRHCSLTRYYVTFGDFGKASKVEKWVGKAAHGQFLDDKLFLQLFTYCVFPQFVCEELAKSTRGRTLLQEFTDAHHDPFVPVNGVVQFLEDIQDEEFSNRFGLTGEKLLYETECSCKKGSLTLEGNLYAVPLIEIVVVNVTSTTTIEVALKEKTFSFTVFNGSQLSSMINQLIADQQRRKIEKATKLGSVVDHATNENSVLNGLSSADWELLLSKAEQLTFKEGDIILDLNENKQSLFNISKGTAKMVGKHGERMGTITSKTGIFGELSLLSTQTSYVQITALQDVELWKIGESVLNEIFEGDIEFRARFYCSIAKMVAAKLIDTTRVLTKMIEKNKNNKSIKKKKDLIEHRIILGLSAAEPIIKFKKCSLSKSGIMKHVGSLFILQNSVAFCSSVFGCETKIFLPFAADNMTITLNKKHIDIKAKDITYVISGLKRPEKVYEILSTQQIVCKSIANKPKLQRTVSYLQLGSWWDSLLDGASVVTYKMNEVIVSVGAKTQYLFQIVHGSVRLEARNVLLDVLKKKEVFGDVAFLKRGKLGASAIANSKKVRLYALDSNFVASRLAGNAELAFLFFEYLAKRMAGKLKAMY